MAPVTTFPMPTPAEHPHHVSTGTRILGHILDGIGCLKLGVGLHVSHKTHLRALVQHGFHFGRKRNVLYEKFGQLDAIFVNFTAKRCKKLITDFVIVCREIQHGDSGLGQGIGEAAHKNIPDLSGDLIRVKMRIGSRDFFYERSGISDPDGIGAECTKAYGPKFRIPEHEWIFRPPFQIRELPGGYKVDIAFKWRIKRILPAFQRREYRYVLRRQLISTRWKNISELAFMKKYSHLTFSNDELGAVLDFIAIPGKFPNDGIVGVINPFDDVDELTDDFVPKSHIFLQFYPHALGLPIKCFLYFTDLTGVCQFGINSKSEESRRDYSLKAFQPIR